MQNKKPKWDMAEDTLPYMWRCWEQDQDQEVSTIAHACDDLAARCRRSNYKD